MNKEKLESAKNLLFIALGVDIAVTALVVISDFWSVGILKDIGAGRITADQSTISTMEFWDSFAKLMLLTILGVGLGLVKWLNTCYSYAKSAVGASGFKDEAWTTGGWIIPIFNLFKPYQVINEIYKAGNPTYAVPDGWKKESGSGLLLTWWIFWAVTHFIGWIVGKQMFKSAMRDDMTLQQSIDAIEFHAWFCVVFLIVSGLWFVVVGGLTRRLVERPSSSVNVRFHERLEVVNQHASTETPPSVPLTISPEKPVDCRHDTVSQHKTPVNGKAVGYQPMDEDGIYAIVAGELESGNTDKGLWTRLFAECGGDEKQTEVLYIKRRAEKLMAAESIRQQQAAIQQVERRRLEAIEEEKAEQLRRRDTGLAEPELVAAVWDGNWATANRLLSEGVSPFGSDANGASLLDLATKRGDRQMNDLLNSYRAGTTAS